MSINDSIVLFTEPLKHTDFFGAEYIIGLGLIFILMAMITRDMHKWKTLALPMTILLHTLGITQHYLIFAVSTITFGVTNLSMSVVGNILQSARKAVGAVASKTIEPLGQRAKDTVVSGIQAHQIKKSVIPASIKGEERKTIIKEIIAQGRKPKTAKTTYQALTQIKREERRKKGMTREQRIKDALLRVASGGSGKLVINKERGRTITGGQRAITGIKEVGKGITYDNFASKMNNTYYSKTNKLMDTGKWRETLKEVKSKYKIPESWVERFGQDFRTLTEHKRRKR